jgi:hypothetical protein
VCFSAQDFWNPAALFLRVCVSHAIEAFSNFMGGDGDGMARGFIRLFVCPFLSFRWVDLLL